MSRVLPILMAVALLARGGSPAAGAPAAAPRTMPGVIEVRLGPEASRRAAPAYSAALRGIGAGRLDRTGVAAVDALAAGYGAWFEPEFRGEVPPAPGSTATDFTAFYLVHLRDGVDPARATAAFGALAEVSQSCEIPVMQVEAVPDDSLWSGATWFQQPSGHDIHAPAAWDLTTGDSAAVIAIVDTGVIPYHPDLGGTVAGLSGNIWTNRAEAGGLPGVDDDRNGFVDDDHGWDFVNLPSETEVWPGEDWRDQDGDPNDFVGHGTGVAGLAGALSNNRIGITGTAWNARIMPLRAGYSAARNPSGEVAMAFAAPAIRYATRMGATVVNCSFASAWTAGLEAAVSDAVRAGVVVVAAAGNNGGYRYLPVRDDVAAVAATDQDDRLTLFSNRGEWVDVSAPGAALATTTVTRPGLDSLGLRQPTYVPDAYGTSFAAPLVSGAVALLASWRRAQGLGQLPPEEVVLRLRETADDIAAQNPGGGYGGGRLDLPRLLTARRGSRVVHVGAPTVGPAVVMDVAGGGRRVVVVTADSQLVLLDGTTCDTLARARLPGAPLRQLAAADLGRGHGVGLFVGVTGNRVAGLYPNGAARPGWPVSVAASEGALSCGPAVGDLDGDGVAEVVCGAESGTVWAWRVDGTLASGFPFSVPGAGMSAPIALADLDTRPGLEVVAAMMNGRVYAIGGDGALLPGWPVTVGGAPLAPVVARWDGKPVSVVASGQSVLALAADGTPRFSHGWSGRVVQDPALADLDGDGSDEVIVATGQQLPFFSLRAVSAAGVALPGWPRPIADLAQGPPVVGPIGPGGATGVLLFRGGTLLALDGHGDSLAVFPRKGGAGSAPTLADVAGDGATRVVAGTGPRGALYLYDAGEGTWRADAAWPTPRGDFARTGTRLGPALAAVDDVPPARVADLAGATAGPDAVALRWTASGADGASGRPEHYQVYASPEPFDEAGAGAAPIRGLAPASSDAGGEERFTLAGLENARAYWIAVRAVDGSGNASPLSNLVRVGTGAGGPLTGGLGLAVASRTQPASPPVELYWQGPAGTAKRLTLFDAVGRRVRSFALGPDGAGILGWDGRDARGHAVGAGLYLAVLDAGGVRARARLVLVP